MHAARLVIGGGNVLNGEHSRKVGPLEKRFFSLLKRRRQRRLSMPCRWMLGVAAAGAEVECQEPVGMAAASAEAVCRKLVGNAVAGAEAGC